MKNHTKPQPISKSDIICEWCGKRFENKHPRRPNRFCNTSCSAKWRMSRPEFKATLYTPERSAKMSQSRKKQYQTELGKAQAKASSERMKVKNPMHNAETRAKMTRTQQENGKIYGWVGTRGGNGHTTSQELLLHQALGQPWQLQLAIPTKKPRRTGYPTCYKVDVGNQKLKIAVEVDGVGHLSAKQKEKDRKKDTLLASLGWLVLRFPNQKIDNDLTEVLKTIHSSTASR